MDTLTIARKPSIRVSEWDIATNIPVKSAGKVRYRQRWTTHYAAVCLACGWTEYDTLYGRIGSACRHHECEAAS